jgi:hypothetical protein
MTNIPFICPVCHVTVNYDVTALGIVKNVKTGKVLAGTPNGILDTFYFWESGAAVPFVVDSEEIKVNGISMTRGVHYTPTGSLGKIVFGSDYIPQTGDIIMGNYMEA